ncbi:MAG TPA: phenylalanine--tRNA ligase subunit alpha [Pyrinomonadaceae bacterium]|nr:phenylalanine--tRNA ligase subunit alpha [Pyrinomonadaceae bacterium]
MSSEAVDYDAQIASVREAFEREFERFARFRAYEGTEGLSLDEAEALSREVKELATRHAAKKSAVSQLMKLVGRVPVEERARFGQLVQQLDKDIRGALGDVGVALLGRISLLKTERERVDVTLPGRRPRRGHLHPITQLRQRIEDVFVSMGYAVEDGPEVETDFYNFTALNIPELHPARSPQDTFYTTDGLSLRSQTSTVQIHAMQRRRPPLRVVAPGRVFRRDTPDATHNPMFFQVEGLLVDRGITMGHLKGTLSEFVRRLFGAETRTRFRPSYFPFTEPSMEADYSCFKCGGAGCRLCKGSGWIELGGSGMVHPNVLRAVNIDPEEFSGFAFGLGIDRMCGLMYELDDIRLLFENDVRFLEQF